MNFQVNSRSILGELVRFIGELLGKFLEILRWIPKGNRGELKEETLIKLLEISQKTNDLRSFRRHSWKNIRRHSMSNLEKTGGIPEETTKRLSLTPGGIKIKSPGGIQTGMNVNNTRIF